MLPQMIGGAELRNGKYVLATFGLSHVIGIDHYMRHPVLRDMKSAMYAWNYGLVDNDEIARFDFRNGRWEKSVITPK